jgi:hypothetical protein
MADYRQALLQSKSPPAVNAAASYSAMAEKITFVLIQRVHAVARPESSAT